MCHRAQTADNWQMCTDTRSAVQTVQTVQCSQQTSHCANTEPLDRERNVCSVLLLCTLGEFMILQKFELYKVQLTHGANHLYIHGNEKLNCLGSTATSRSQIKSFTVCFLYANSGCRHRSLCKWYNSIRTLPRHSAAMSRCAADWAGAPLPCRGGWWCCTHHPPVPRPARV